MKLKEFQQWLEKEKIDVAIFTSDDPNIKYFTGFDCEYSILEIMQKSSILFVPKMEHIRAKKFSRIPVEVLDDDYFTKLKNKDISMIGINKAHIRVKNYEKLRKDFAQYLIFDTSDKVTELRRIKTDEEIKIMQQGAEISDKIFKKLLDSFSKFKTETEVANFIDTEAKLLGYKMAFPTIVASGLNAKMPHHVPKNEKLEKGFCVIDFGIICQGYCTDMTRTLFIGEQSLEIKELYNKVLNIQQKCIESSLPGKSAKSLHKIAAKELGENLIHSLGHGVGIEIHESPNISDKSQDVLEENNVITIEPGYYGQKHGIRIEDTIVIKANKAIILNKSQKELIFI